MPAPMLSRTSTDQASGRRSVGSRRLLILDDQRPVTFAFAAMALWGSLLLGAAPSTAADTVPTCSAEEIAAAPQTIRSLHDLQSVLADPARGKDQCAALTELIQLGETGNSAATLLLGDIFSAGAVVPVDADRAVSYYLKALELGEQAALLRLGDLYRDGKVVAADQKQAVFYYEQLLTSGDAVAAVRLGDLYLKGAGSVARDSARAITYYESALAGGQRGVNVK